MAPGRGCWRFWAGLLGGTPAAHDRVVAAGAVLARSRYRPRPGSAGQPVPWRVNRDPAGHPFCLVVR